MIFNWRIYACWRTAFLAMSLTIGHVASLPAQQLQQVDVLLRNGEIHRGDGESAIMGDVAISGDRIVAVGKIDSDVRPLRTIDCTGLIVCPGFIDLHNHSDNEILAKETLSAMNYLTQGCTTLVTGNCGSGPIDVAKYYDSIDRNGAGLNIMHLLPQGSLRQKVIGSEQRKATPEELDQMRELTRKAMQEGAWGMSTGLIYVPGSYADTDELVMISEVVGLHGGIYASHIRNEGPQLLDSVNEALEIGQRAKLPVHISHFKSSGKDSWGLVRTAVEIIKQRRAEGQIVTADQYPYTASSTSLEATCIPVWARAGGREAMMQRIDKGDEQSKRIINGILEKLEVTDNGHRIQIASCSAHPEWAGQRLDEIAAGLKIAAVDLVVQIERNGGASVVNHSIDESDVRFVMQQEWVATASDGSAKLPSHAIPHPRSYGTFPRRIGHYAHREHVISLEHAIYSATGLPAQIMGIKDRGFVQDGCFADIVVFSRDSLIDRSTFVQPHQYSAGVVHLFVNGQPVIADAHATGALSGRAIRKHAANQTR